MQSTRFTPPGVRQRRAAVPAVIALLLVAALLSTPGWGSNDRAAQQADALQALSDSLVSGGALVGADSVLHEAVAMRRAAADPIALATTLIASAEVRKLVGRLDEAEALAREAIALRREHLGSTHVDVADALYELAMILDQSRRTALAGEIQTLLEECLAIRKRALGADDPSVLKTRVALALRDATPGGRETGRKERLLRECLADQRRVLAKNDPDLIETLFWLSDILKVQGEGDEALELAAEALEIQRLHQPDHPDMGFCLNQVATIYTRVGRYADATHHFEKAYELQLRTLGPEAAEPLLAQANLASAYGNQGDPVRAESLLVAILERARHLEKSGIEVRRVYGSVHKKRMKVAEQAGRFAAAESLLLHPVGQALKGLPEHHAEFQERRTWLGRARAGQGDFARAEQYLNEAVRLYELARDAIGTGTAPATFDETPYETRALVRLELGRPAEAWTDVETSRGRLLGEALLGKNYGPMSLAKVQASLSADEAIVGWVDHHLHYGGGRSWAYVLRQHGPVRWERLPRDPAESSEQLGRRYSEFRDHVVLPGTQALGAAESDFPAAEARSLWIERLAPIERHLVGVRSLVLVPSSAMGGIPVGALVDAEGRRAIERWTLRYGPSATLRTYLAQGRPAQRPRSSLLVGDPPLRALHLASAQPVRRGLDQATVRGVLRGERVALGSLPRLPWTRQEVESIATLFQKPQVYVGAAATETAIARLARSGSLAGFDVIHLATHALMDGARPARSALVLSQLDVQPDSPADGILTAHEIGAQWKLASELVTLSACETALGRNILGEGTVGFAHHLMRSGAKSVLASLWSVNDESSELLMRRFYENWLGQEDAPTPRMKKAEALREAQLSVRDWRDPRGEQPFRHPYYWSAFVLVGD